MHQIWSKHINSHATVSSLRLPYGEAALNGLPSQRLQLLLVRRRFRGNLHTSGAKAAMAQNVLNVLAGDFMIFNYGILSIFEWLYISFLFFFGILSECSWHPKLGCFIHWKLFLIAPGQLADKALGAGVWMALASTFSFRKASRRFPACKGWGKSQSNPSPWGLPWASLSNDWVLLKFSGALGVESHQTTWNMWSTKATESPNACVAQHAMRHAYHCIWYAFAIYSKCIIYFCT